MAISVLMLLLMLLMLIYLILLTYYTYNHQIRQNVLYYFYDITIEPKVFLS